MARAFDIIGIGTAFIDDLLAVDEYPPPDAKAPIRGETRAFGGCIAAGLAAAARLGASCAYAGVFGSDSLSASMMGGFTEAGVDTGFVLRRDGATPGHSVIISDRTHGTRNIFFNTAGCTPLPVEAVSEEMIAQCKVLMVDHFGPETALAAAKIARRLGRSVVSDLEWADCPRLDEVFAAVDHLISSAGFAAAVTGETDPAEAVRALHRPGRACTAVTCGVDGSYFLAGDSTEVTHQGAFRVKTIETTGCGDVFHGAYAATLARGASVRDCIRVAAAAAAVYAGRPQGWQHLATGEDVEALMKASQLSR